MAFNQIIEFILQNDLVFAAIVIIGFVGGARIINFTLKKLLYFTKKKETELGKRIVHAIRIPIYIALFLVGLRIALTRIDFLQTYSQLLTQVFSVGWLVLAAIIVVKVIDIVSKVFGRIWARESKVEADTLLKPVSRLIKGLVAFFIALSILGVFGIDITPFIFGWGLLGFAIVLALQPVLMDIFSGFSVIATKSFKVGDKIVLPTGEICEIKDIKMQNTIVRDLINKNYYSISNTELTKQKITLLPEGRLRVLIPFKVSYDDVERATKMALEIGKNVKERATEPVVHTLELGDTSKLELSFWINEASKKHEVIDEVYSKLIKEFKKSKISLK